MRPPVQASAILAFVATLMPKMPPTQQRGLAEWGHGVLLAESGCESAVVAALADETGDSVAAVRQRVREWLRDGTDKVAPCQTQVTVDAYFRPILAWIVQWWRHEPLVLLIDATAHHQHLVAVVVSVAYRGTALPVAWTILPGHTKGAWLTPLVRLLELLAPAIPADRFVLVESDRGFWSPVLWHTICAHGWHPLLRIRPDAVFRPTGQARVKAASLAAPGEVWIGAGTAFRHHDKQLPATLVVVRDQRHDAPWLLLTDLAPEHVNPHWYGLRMTIEASFATLKSRGWQWQRTRRRDPRRVARHWLVLAVADLLVLSTGTRIEEAARRNRDPAHLPVLDHAAPAAHPRVRSVFQRGLRELHTRLLRRQRLWSQRWLLPESCPIMVHFDRLICLTTPQPP